MELSPALCGPLGENRRSCSRCDSHPNTGSPLPYREATNAETGTIKAPKASKGKNRHGPQNASPRGSDIGMGPGYSCTLVNALSRSTLWPRFILSFRPFLPFLNKAHAVL